MGVAKKGINRVVGGYADLFDMLGGLIRWDIDGSLDKINTRHKRIKQVDEVMNKEKARAKQQKEKEQKQNQRTTKNYQIGREQKPQKQKCKTGQLTL